MPTTMAVIPAHCTGGTSPFEENLGNDLHRPEDKQVSSNAKCHVILKSFLSLAQRRK
jgi:hypothetical protein